MLMMIVSGGRTSSSSWTVAARVQLQETMALGSIAGR
jgi:hypothetical protein